MNGSIKNTLDFLAQANTLNSIGFSSRYDFSERELNQYFSEISHADKFFMGLMVFENNQGDYKIIDGLQRLTTLCLLLSALCEAYKDTSKKNNDARQKIIDRYLLSNGLIKLNLVGFDKEIYEKIVTGGEISDEQKETPIYRVFNDFLIKIRENKISATKLFKSISATQFMYVKSEEIPARDLYYSINTHKKDLSQINLITNLILSKDEIHSRIWLNTMAIYANNELLGEFLKDFITIQNNGHIPSALYKEFKAYFNNILKFQTLEKTMRNLEKFAKYYLQIVNSDFEDAQIKAQFESINQAKAVDTYAYLMEVLDDLALGHINDDILGDILNLVNSFITDRQSAEPSSITMNFASLSVELNKMLMLKEQTPRLIDESKLTINDIMSA